MISRRTYIENKIVSPEKALQRINTWQLKDNKVVFTNGCFDILHEGHVTYLAEAAELGNRLVVGLNTDQSVRRQEKGDDRPVNAEASRAMVLASLGIVDLVVLFDADTPLELIKLLKPDILVKGADYDPEETNSSSPKYIVGSDIVRSYGGTVAAVPLIEGFSTTGIIKRMRS